MTAVRAAATELVTAGVVREVATAALERAGAGASEARVQATQLVEAELRGHPSHGIRRLAVLVGRLRAGLIVPHQVPTTTLLSPAAIAVDGHFGFGPVTAWAALDELAPRAAQNGIGIAVMRNTHHLGMVSPYLERLAEQGFVALALTTSEGLVHPWGGSGALVGTNPIGIAVPSREGPLVLDMSTGTTSAGKVRDYAARNEALPEGWAVDGRGHPTTDARAAVTGAISPFGGAKGYGLGIAFGAIVGLLTRTAYGADVTGTLDAVHPSTKGDVFIAVSTETFGAGVDDEALSKYLDAVRASGVDGAAVLIPGDRSRASRTEKSSRGIPVDVELWESVLTLAQRED